MRVGILETRSVCQARGLFAVADESDLLPFTLKRLRNGKNHVGIAL